MAGKELIVDDEFCEAIGSSFISRGDRADLIISYYLNIMKSINSSAVVSGEAAQALEAFIVYAEVIKDKIGNMAALEKRQTDNFLTAIDSADRYLF